MHFIDRSRHRKDNYNSLLEKAKEMGRDILKRIRFLDGRKETAVLVKAMCGCSSAAPKEMVHVRYGESEFPCTYEMRWISNTNEEERDVDLRDIINLNMADPNIREVNKDKDRCASLKMYQEWHRACPHGFLLLKEVCHCGACSELEPLARELLVAATIVLPLGEEPIIQRQGIQAGNLEGKDISNRATKNLLLDTLVSRWGYKHQMKGFQWSLLLQHVHHFLPTVSKSEQQLVFWCEPDEPGGPFDEICDWLGRKISRRRTPGTWTYAATVRPSKLSEVLEFDALSEDEKERLDYLQKVLKKIDSMSFVIT